MEVKISLWPDSQGKGGPVPVTLLTSIFMPKEQNNFFLNLSIKSLVISCFLKWWHRATMEFFLQQTSTEQNLTATEIAIKEEEITEQVLGNHHTEYQHLHTHT